MKTFLLVVSVIAIIAVLVGLMRVRVHFVYGENGAKVFLNVLFLKFGIYPNAKRKVRTVSKQDKVSKDKKGGDFSKILDLLKLAKELSSRLRQKLYVDNLILDITTASSDPFKTAMFFGGSGAAVGVMLAILENLFIIKEKKISVNADFSAQKTVAYMDLKLSLTVAQLLSLAFHAVYKYIKLQKTVDEN